MSPKATGSKPVKADKPKDKKQVNNNECSKGMNLQYDLSMLLRIVAAIILLIIVVSLYFLPYIIGRHNRSAGTLFLCNLFSLALVGVVTNK